MLNNKNLVSKNHKSICEGQKHPNDIGREPGTQAAWYPIIRMNRK